jgi:hypothetical protein
MYVGYPIENFVVGDLRGSVKLDLGRKALGSVVVRANHSSVMGYGILNEGEETVDCHAQAPVDSLTGLEVENGGYRVGKYENVEPMDVYTEAGALNCECIPVEILFLPPLARCFEIGDLTPGAGDVTARDGSNEQSECGKSY